MQNNKTNQTLLLSLSAAFEYYDFVIYALMVNYLGPLFFPSKDLLVSQMQAFAAFSLGYIVRPLGGIILGSLGDLTNKAKIFVNSNLLLALATLSISLLPSYNNLGIISTILIIMLRIMQAFCFSAEIPGAMTLIKDNTKNPNKSFSFIVSGAALGSIIASLSLYLLEENFTKEEILDYAWRIPFIFGALLCIISLILRKKLTSLQQQVNKSNWINSIIAEYKRIISFVLVISIPSYLILMNLFFPSFLPKFYGFNTSQVYLSISISLIWTIFYAPIFAYITNKLNKVTLLQTIIVASIFLSILIHYLLKDKKIIIAVCLYQSIISSFMVIIFPLMSEKFSSNTQFTLMASCYNISLAITSFIPLAATNIAASLNSPFIIWAILIFLCIFTLANMRNIYEPNNQ